MIGVIIEQKEEVKMREKLAEKILNLDDWFARRGIYFNYFNKNDKEHISFLTRLGFKLWFK